MKTCNTCKANKVCNHDKYGFENCGNYIPDEKTCKDCIHYDVCNFHIDEEATMTVNECDHFKNKADYAEVETVKSWLYKIAINNVGCAFDGDFFGACEEIISRLDGLRKFSQERREEMKERF